jgi:hypothetical protein
MLDGLAGWCRDCDNAKARERYASMNEAERESRLKYLRTRYREDPKRQRDWVRQWCLANPEKARAGYRRVAAKRRASDHVFRAGLAIRSSIQRAAKGRKAGRKTWDLLGYTAQELRTHLEALFVPGMSWSNYGSEWHIDHRRPIASFSFDRDLEAAIRKCWALSNLQPLWGPENQRKHAKWNGTQWSKGAPL